MLCPCRHTANSVCSTVAQPCPLHGPAQRLQKPQPRPAVCKAARSSATRWASAPMPGNLQSCRRRVSLTHSTPVHLHLAPGQAVQLPTSSKTLRCSAASSSQDFPADASSSPNDDLRKASNAAASTSASQPAAASGSSKQPASPVEQVFVAAKSKLVAMFQSIAAFFKALPAFIQREKLQRLHKRALDEPTNADRQGSPHYCTCCPTALLRQAGVTIHHVFAVKPATANWYQANKPSC